MHTDKCLHLNGQLASAIGKIGIQQEDGRQIWRVELILRARGDDDLGAQRHELEASLKHPLSNAALYQGELLLREMQAGIAEINIDGLSWNVDEENRLSGECLGELILSQAIADSQQANWTRTIERKDGKARLIIAGQASGLGAEDFALGLRDSIGATPIEERLTSDSNKGEVAFTFIFADQSNSEIDLQESVRVRQRSRVVEHVPLSVTAPPILQRIGMAAIEAEQSGQARSSIDYPASADPLWPGQAVEHDRKQETLNGEFVTSWRYLFALPFNPLQGA